MDKPVNDLYILFHNQFLIITVNLVLRFICQNIIMRNIYIYNILFIFTYMICQMLCINELKIKKLLLTLVSYIYSGRIRLGLFNFLLKL